MQPDREPNGNWRSGQSGNPDGRPAGARNRSSYELRERLKARGDIDPAEFLSSLVSNEKEPKELRIAASGQLMPYYHSKLGTIPVPVPKIYLETEIHLPCPEPKTIEQVNANIWYLHQLKLTGQIDQAWSDNLINDQRILGNNIIDHDKLLAAQDNPNADRKIIITGGLPSLPGCDVIMPQINGKHMELEAINHATDNESDHSVPGPATPDPRSAPEPDKP
jgi:hypothetical protein